MSTRALLSLLTKKRCALAHSERKSIGCHWQIGDLKSSFAGGVYGDAGPSGAGHTGAT